VGPGGHISDALMLGLDPGTLRDRMAEALRVIVRLMTDTTPLSVTSEWFTLRDAVLQLRPFQQPTPPIAVTSMESPAGMRLAGEMGAGAVADGRQIQRRCGRLAGASGRRPNAAPMSPAPTSTAATGAW